MDYVSTRNRERKVSAAYAIANGIAPDGGLYWPKKLEVVPLNECWALSAW